MSKRQRIIIIVGAIVGAFFGSSIGIAGFGGGIAGTIPLAILGGYIGYRFSQNRE
jgi:hypothetical protein